MMYRLTISDGTAFIVTAVDLPLITAYLVLGGFPPVTVEVTDQVDRDVNLSDKQTET